MHRYITYIFLILISNISGCSLTPDVGRHTVSPKYLDIHKKSAYSKIQVKNMLIKQEKDWHGTPHRTGGLSRRGIDCSGFVFITFRDKFGIDLPRSTELQKNIGLPVKQKELQYGDLVFFKTGLFARHVGIYVGNRQFIHASTSKGVTRDSLDDYYWSGKYWKAKRVIVY
jgi:cell wall-associated NlpC family hydrolase